MGTYAPKEKCEKRRSRTQCIDSEWREKSRTQDKNSVLSFYRWGKHQKTDDNHNNENNNKSHKTHVFTST